VVGISFWQLQQIIDSGPQKGGDLTIVPGDAYDEDILLQEDNSL
jgi:hypothetical protein